MTEILADLPAPACFPLHFESRTEENQLLGPDLLRFSAPDKPVRDETAARDPDGSARDRGGRFVKGHSGNPKGRPRGISNPKRRTVTLDAWRANPEACKALFRRQPWLLRRLVREFFPPASARDPAERLGIRVSSIRTPVQARHAIKRVWSALRRGEIGTGDAARIARRIDASWHAAQRRAGIGRAGIGRAGIGRAGIGSGKRPK